ncbi:Crp/Fnr family transcriptional regulator [Acinetobacter pullicarnis]|uniref:Crp/Fnr family transcriptional regulator n=1 Tax=Acinetobacter pullicarnis TaxID=2576829 RepID=UPI0011218C00|nr:Crp/Fnr family transcriptional regulator [Acinetobacter pullicarnis]
MNPILLEYPKLLQTGRIAFFKKKTTLLNEGEICHRVFMIEKGCVRSWFNHDGNDVTFQFFFEGDIVTSFESLKNDLPALYNIETLTEVRLRVISKKELFDLIHRDLEIKNSVDHYITERLYHYQKLFISRIKNNPQQRYVELLNENPDIFEKVPHHYIATYLGITPVSLSRIRTKNKSSINIG